MRPHTWAKEVEPVGVAVLVDARNVLRSRWPNIPEHELVELVAGWAHSKGVRAVLVFDGPAPDLASDEVEVIGTGREESADDWIERAAAELASRGEPHWLVTSDRALRESAGAAAERVIGGGSFARELQPG
jgi:predicted RNA-binding protein with PIN domain